jgi:hypothetical protein
VRNSSPFDGHGRAGLRVVLAAVLAFDTLLLSHFLAGVHPGPASHPHAPGWLLAFAGRAWLIAIVAVAAVLSLAAFARRAASVLPGWLALACVGLLVEAHAACIEGPYRIFFSGGAAMLGWMVGVTYARATGREGAAAERHGEFGAAAGLAATYVDAFASKTLAGGIGWTDADSLRAVVLTQHHVGGSWLSNAYAAAVADHAWLAGTLVTLTLVAQASALAYPLHPVTRGVSGTLLLAFHANTAILTPLFFPQAMVLLVALSYPWPAIARRVKRDGATAATEQPATAIARTRTPRVVLLGALLAGALVAWASPLRSYTLAHHRHGPTAAAATALPMPPSLARVLEGLNPGARVGSWEVRSVSATPTGARLDLVSGPSLLHVLVVPHGTVPGDPPASTRRYDVLYETPHPGETRVADADRTVALEDVAASIRDRE